MPITNIKKWNSYVTKNQDPYGKCCVDVARRIMEILDKDPTPLEIPGNGSQYGDKSAFKIICNANDDIKAGGITGFMAGCVAQMVVECHSRGEEFRKSHNWDIKGDGVVNRALATISIPEIG
jgi:hypothetical protein